MDNRLTRLEVTVDHIQDNLREVRTDMRDLRSELRHFQTEVRADFSHRARSGSTRFPPAFRGADQRRDRNGRDDGQGISLALTIRD